MPAHARSRVAHNFPDPFSFFWFETVDRTIRTERFVLAEGTLSDSLFGVIGKLPTSDTRNLTAMVIPAVELDHQTNGFGFPIHPQSYTKGIIITYDFAQGSV